MSNVDALRLLILDCDGVLTDGSILVDDLGRESKRFHVRDGFAIKAAMGVGLQIAVCTGRSVPAVNLRLTELGVKHVLQGASDKLVGLETICQWTGVEPGQAAYMGDDLPDIPAMVRCGFAITVADAAAEVVEVAAMQTEAPGGHGAVREAVEHILRTQNRWDEIVDRYVV